jgi:CRISPR-associated protein Cmr1
MHTITFTCEVLTPLFLNGADGRTPELRAPSIKGALRFWWRALHGHLPLKAHSGLTTDLKSLETQIFGGSGDQVQRSKVLVQVVGVDKSTKSTNRFLVNLYNITNRIHEFVATYPD